MLKSLIREERDLRRLLRTGAFGKRIRWIEPSIGSTIGLPDCFLQWGQPGQPTVLWVELKIGNLAPRNPGVMLFSIRAEQKACITQMRYEGMKVGMIVAEQHSRKIFGVRGDAAVHGSFELRHAMPARISEEGEVDWREIFNFLFFDRISVVGG